MLPGVDGRSLWARLYGDVQGALITHLGGADRINEPQRLLVRRCSALEVELLALEGAFNKARESNGEPDPAALDLYARLAGVQRRFLADVGMSSVPRELVPDLETYTRQL